MISCSYLAASSRKKAKSLENTYSRKKKQVPFSSAFRFSMFRTHECDCSPVVDANIDLSLSRVDLVTRKGADFGPSYGMQ